MQISNSNNVKIYSVSSSSKAAIPEWLVRRNSAKLKYDSAWRNRIELVQDFEFPEASIKIKMTPDGQFIMATGVYQPQIRVFDLAHMSMKFERHVTCENIAFEILSSDWTKSVHLQADRSVEFHSHYGMHYSTRVPKFGRDLAYHFPSCDLFVVGASHEAWRLNLEQGRFLSALETSLPEINTTTINPAHQLLAFGGSDGNVEFWDHRCRKRVGVLDVGMGVVKGLGGGLLEELPQISSMAFDSNGLGMVVGTVTDHQYGYPIKSLAYHSSGNVLSADTKICKIWNKENGNVFTSVENPCDINDICINPDSGLLMVANEGAQMQSYYIPSLGPAPKWCPFLENLTEELEEAPTQALYDDYKFVTKKELENLGMGHLIGTNVLKAYMHGFFVDARLYEKARAIANPFEFAEHKKRLVQQKIETKRASRISAIKKLPKVNMLMAAKLTLDDEDPKKKRKVIENQTEENPIGDDRFGSLFNDSEFQIDTTSHEYKLHHPSESQKRFEPIDGDESGSDDNALRNIRHKKVKMFGVAAQENDDAFMERVLGQKIEPKVEIKAGGNRCITFKPVEKKSGSAIRGRGDRDSKRGRGDEDGREGKNRKRGVGDLGFKSERGGRGGRGGSRGSSRGSSRGGSRGSSRGASRGGRGRGRGRD